MSKNPEIPDTWGIPHDQAKKIQETLNRNPRSSPMVVLVNTLKETATKIADHEPEPDDWVDWITYLLEQLQAEADKDFKAENFEVMLIDLRGSVNARIVKGKWK